MKEKKINKNNIIALIMLITLVVETFSPISLLTTISNAASMPQQPAVVIKRSTDIQSSSGGKWFQVEFAFVGDFYPYMFDLKLKYDASKIEPANKSTKKKATKLAQAVNLESAYSTTFMTSTSYLDTAENTFRLIPSTGEPENPAVDYNGYMLIYTMTFRLTDDTLTEDGLTSNLLTLTPTAATAGFKFGWDENEGQGNPTPKYSEDSAYLKWEGFIEESSTVVDSISIKTNPSNAIYEHGDTINLDGGEITVSYADGKTEDISMTDPRISMISGKEADASHPQVTVSYGGKQASFDITVNDPIDSLKIKNPMSNIEYNHGDNLNFTGLQIEATKKSGAKVDLTKESEGVTVSEETANINSEHFTKTSGSGVVPVSGKQEIIFYYEGKQVKQTVIVNDTINTIEVIKQPSKTIYKRGETLELSGAVVKVTLGSGNTTNINLPDGSVTVKNYSSTTIGTKQQLPVNLGEKKASKTIDIEVYNYVKTSAIISPSDTNPNYNTELDLSGGKLTLIWHNNKIENIDLTDSSITIKGYNKNQIGEQTVTVEYPVTYTLSDGTTISDKVTESFIVEVENPIKTISITAPSKTEYKHGEELATNGTITVTFSNNKTEKRTMTTDMIFENDGTTQASTSPTSYDDTNKVSKTLKITYTEDEKTETIEYPITIINTVKEINLQENAKKQYNVNEGLQNGLSIFVTREVGLPEGIEITDEMISGFDTSTEGTRTATITYKENGVTKTANYTYTVTDTVKSISMGTAPKEAQKYGEELDLEGATIEVVKGSKTETKELESTMIKAGTYDKEKLGEQTVTVEYGTDAEGNPVTATFTVKVKDYMTGISINPNSITGKYNDELSKLLTDNHVKYTVTYAKAGEKITENLTEDMVAGYNKKTTEAQNLTVTYTDNDADSYTKGEDKTATLNIVLKDEVSSVEIENTPKTNYKYGESLDVSKGTLKVVRTSGETSIPIKPEMVTETDGKPFNGKKLGTRNLNVTYGGITKTYEITVSDYVKGVILTPPTKVKYEYGENLDLRGGSIQKVMASETATSPVSLSDSSVTLSTFNPNKEGAQTITVTYEGFTEKFGVIVEDNIQSITLQEPTKKQYRYGESLNVAGGKITTTRTSGKTETINITTSMVTGYKPNQLGPQTLTVTYKGKTATYSIHVEDYVKDIEIVKPNKLIYKIGEDIDLTGGQVKTVMASGTATFPVAMPNADVKVTGFDSTSEGAKLIKVTYQGITKTFGITVVDKLNDMRLKTLPNKLDYRYGESLDVTGGTIEIEKESGAKEIIKMTSSMVTGYNPKKLGPQTLTVTYQGLKEQFIVNVEDYVSKLKIQAPSKVEYEYGEYLDLIGGKVSIIMASGKTEEAVEMTASMVSGFNAKQEGKQTIKVDYKGLQGTFQVNVVDRIKGISMNTEPNKVIYHYGENLDLTEATINVVKSSGIKTIPVTQNMISGYDANTSGTQLITITYGGFTTKFIVKVNEPEVPVKPESPQKPDNTTDKPNNTTKEPSKTPEKSQKGKPSKNLNLQAQKTIKEQNTTEQTTLEQQENTQVEAEASITKEVDASKERTTEKSTQEESKEKSKDKPTETLGVKDKKIKDSRRKRVIQAIIGGIELLLLLILIFFRRNVKIYVEENGELVLGGLDKITTRHLKLNINQYLDGETYPNGVKICLSKSISRKLDGKTIKIKHREKVLTRKIKYNNKPFEIILK